MKPLKSLYDKLQANKWVYWFIGCSVVLFISQNIQQKPITEILFAQYSGRADKILMWLFISMIGYFITVWIIKYKNKSKVVEK